VTKRKKVKSVNRLLLALIGGFYGTMFGPMAGPFFVLYILFLKSIFRGIGRSIAV
jgi:hypothetical protein